MRMIAVGILISFALCSSAGAVPESDGFDFPVGDINGAGYNHTAGWDFLEWTGSVYHPGEDWNANTGGNTDEGKPVYAASKGTIVAAGDYGSGWGKIIVVEHLLPQGTRLWTQYAHLKDILRSSGDVARREQIGTIGRGHNNEYSAHLHFEIRIQFRAPNAWVTGWTKVKVLDYYTDPSEFIAANRIIDPPPPPVGHESNGTRHQGIIDAYNRNGGAGSVGNPASFPPYSTQYVHGYYGSGYKQDFNNGSGGDGSIFQQSFGGPNETTVSPGYWVHGAIWRKYDPGGAESGRGPNSPLGWPITDELEAIPSPYGTTGRVSHFEGGYIHYSPPLGTWITHGDIAREYASTGGSGGVLGFPNTDNNPGTSSFGTTGQYAGFEGGQILWPRAGPGGTGEAYALWGALVHWYGQNGGLSGGLGFPNTGHIIATSPQGTTGDYAGFEGGQILWPRTGPGGTGKAYDIWGAILDRYRAIDGIGGGFGFPNTGHVGATSPHGTTGDYAGFEGGQILWPRTGPGGTGQAYALWGRLLDRYRAIGGIGGILGFPNTGHVGTTSPQGTTGNYAGFEGGQILWPRTGPGGTGEAYALWGALVHWYGQNGGSSGGLGFPNTGHIIATSPQGTTGDYASFEGGRILWPRTGPGGTGKAYDIWGAILDRYKEVGGAEGGYGYPNTLHVEGVSPQGTTGHYVGFEGGQILWPRSGPAAGGARLMRSGPVLTKYRDEGGVTAYLGWPRGDVNAVTSFSGKGGQRAHFEGGAIYSSILGTFVVQPPIMWSFFFEKHGFPKGPARQDGVRIIQDFELGPVIIDPRLPAAPSELKAKAMSQTHIDLTWTDNAASETGFRIERRVGAAAWAFRADVTKNIAWYNDTGLQSNTQYTYRVRAFNAIGNSGYANTASATTLPIPPAAPTGLTATAGASRSIVLRWRDNSTNESGFRIERKSGANGFFAQIAGVGAGVTAYTNGALFPGSNYTYRVRAFNSGGNSGYSNVASATAPR